MGINRHAAWTHWWEERHATFGGRWAFLSVLVSKWLETTSPGSNLWWRANIFASPLNNFQGEGIAERPGQQTAAVPGVLLLFTVREGVTTLEAEYSGNTTSLRPCTTWSSTPNVAPFDCLVQHLLLLPGFEKQEGNRGGKIKGIKAYYFVWTDGVGLLPPICSL